MNKRDYNDLSFSDKAAKLVADIARAYLHVYRGVSGFFRSIKEKISRILDNSKNKNDYSVQYANSKKKNGKKEKNAYKDINKKQKKTSFENKQSINWKEKFSFLSVEKLKEKIDFSSKKEQFTNGIEAIKEFIVENKVKAGAGLGIAMVMIAAMIMVPPMLSNTKSSTVEKSALADIQLASAPVALASGAAQGESVEFTGELLDNQAIMDMGVEVYALMVNGKEVAVFENEDSAGIVLEALKSKFNQVPEEESDRESVEYKKVFFKEDIEIVKSKKKIASFDGFKDNEAVLEYIIKGTDEVRTHQVQKGENFWVIAQSYGIRVKELEDANPDVKPERLQINQIISLIVPKPLITVVTVQESQYIEDIKYEVTYEDSAKIYKGEYSVKLNGQLGERDVVAEIFSENGREIGRNIVSENILKEPSTKIVYKGTKDPPPRIGTGSFMKPLSRGWVSSPFGVWRGSSRHTGIDIAVPTGTAIKAADGGKVIFAGTNGSYGKCVIIDHGGFMSTLYAHNSKLLVKKGDNVFKGQKVSLSGNTGRSTGPHLHFEIRKNNIPINPTKYVRF